MTVPDGPSERVRAVSTAVGLLLAGALLGGALALPATVALPTGWDVAGTVALSGTGYAVVAITFGRSRDVPMPVVARDGNRALEVAIGLVVALVLFGVQWIASAALGDGGIAATSRYVAVADASWPAFVVLAFAGVVIVPPAEELLFRGAILARLAASFSDATAILAAGVLFALVHVPTSPEAGPVAIAIGTGSALVSGVILGALYLGRGSLAAPVVAHAGFNAVSFGTLALEATGGGSGV